MVAYHRKSTCDEFVEWLLWFSLLIYDNVDNKLAKIYKTSTVSEYQSCLSTIKLEGGQKGSWWELSFEELSVRNPTRSKGPMIKDNHICIFNCKNTRGKDWCGKSQKQLKWWTLNKMVGRSSNAPNITCQPPVILLT